MSDEKKVTVADRLRVKVNPEYDHDEPPESQEFAYVNPVALNNDLIKIANEMLALADASVAAQKKVVKAKLEKRKLERELEGIEEDLLRDDALSPSEAKSLKTIQAAVARRAKENDKLAKIAQLRVSIAQLEDVIETQHATVSIAKLYWDTADRLGDNIKIHLSYVKRDRELSRYGT